MFNELNKGTGKRFTFNSDGLPFINLAEVIDRDGNFTKIVRGVFTYQAKHGIRPAVITDKEIINCPEHIIKKIDVILERADLIDAINRGECAIESYQYTDKDGKSRNSIRFIDAPHKEVPFDV